jgi:hypothetical protein
MRWDETSRDGTGRGELGVGGVTRWPIWTWGDVGGVGAAHLHKGARRGELAHSHAARLVRARLVLLLLGVESQVEEGAVEDELDGGSLRGREGSCDRAGRASLTHMVQVWSKYGRSMVQVWSKYGPSMVQVWSLGPSEHRAAARGGGSGRHHVRVTSAHGRVAWQGSMGG